MVSLYGWIVTDGPAEHDAVIGVLFDLTEHMAARNTRVAIVPANLRPISL